MGLRINEETPKVPIRIPISALVDPILERYTGSVVTRMWLTNY